ncbi:MAG: RtcB family protein [Nitrospinales bacterium]
MKVLHNKIQTNKWLINPLTKDIKRAISKIERSVGVRFVALMPDIHLSGDVCIGTVMATDSIVYPQAVGNDIGCGMLAMRFDCLADDLFNEINASIMLNELYKFVPSNRHSSLTKKDVLPKSILGITLSNKKLEKAKSRDGLVQFGTLGRGNHFLEFQADEQDRLWITVHTGSRAIGQMITKHHLKLALKAKSGFKYFESESEYGKAYLNDQRWARSYANASRWEILERVVNILNKKFLIESVDTSLITCDHNHVQEEVHFGEKLFVHRKGSLSANEGELGIIPGSMGTATYHTVGRGNPESLNSSSHGAGRAMSRGEAHKNITVKYLHKQMKGIWFDYRKSSHLVDEAPSAYKNIDSVMRAQGKLTRIIRKLKPILNFKGG